MSIGKDTQSNIQAYVGLLSGLKLGQGFFNQLNNEFAKLILELFKKLMETNQLGRKDEFLDDLIMFGHDMLRKYGTTEPYGYHPRSPYEKRIGIESQCEGRQKHIFDNLKRRYDNDEDDYSY